MDVEIDGHPARLKGQGDQLQLVLGREETLHRLLDSNTSLARQLASILADERLTLTVVYEHQPLLKVGHGISSRVSGFLTGSRHIAPANFPGLLKLLRSYLSSRTAARQQR